MNSNPNPDYLHHWQPLVDAWWKRFRDASVSVNELCSELQLDTVGNHLLPVEVQRCESKGMCFKRSLGRRLRKLCWYRVGKLLIRYRGNDTIRNVCTFSLQVSDSEMSIVSPQIEMFEINTIEAGQLLAVQPLKCL